MKRFALWAFAFGACAGLVARSTPARAETLLVPSCELSDVQQAVDAAADGDVVVLPAGSCVWSSGLALDLQAGAGRALELRGAGMTETTIHVQAGLADIRGAAGKPWRLTSLRVVTEYAAPEQTAIQIGGAAGAWRVDHLELVANESPHPPLRHIYVAGPTYGLIDHCRMVGEIASPIVVDGENWQSWREPQLWGSAQAVYIEDNVFHAVPNNHVPANGTTDCNRGGRFVFRYNTVRNQITQCHGFDSGQQASCQSMEVYGNAHEIRTDGSLAWAWLGQIRGGTALWFDNTWQVDPYEFPPDEAGVWLNSTIALRVYRAEGSAYGWHPCDGTPLRLCSNIAANWTPLDDSWWPLTCTSDADCTAAQHMGNSDAVCKWRFCSGDGMRLCDPASGDADCDGAGLGTCSRFVDGPGDGTPCFQQPGRSTANASSPAYEWHNSCEGAQPAACPGGLGAGNVHFGEGIPQLEENLDYYNYQGASFDGTRGTGRGLLADRPASCVPYVAYWGTDTQTLYRCAAPDTWESYYVPYPYPHPLQSGDASCGNGICDPNESCASCPQDCCPDGGIDPDGGGAGGSGPADGGGGIGGSGNPAATGPDDSGCGCRTVRTRSGNTVALGLLWLLVGYGVRRSARAPRRSRSSEGLAPAVTGTSSPGALR